MTERSGPPRTGDLEIGLRRAVELDPAPVPESDPRLATLIADEIRDRGPMPFSRFMELALYAPGLGYYVRPGGTDGGGGVQRGPGRRGDFLTAPESHPIFGWAIARHLEDAWQALGRPPRFVVREHGAGTGALAGAILDGLRRSGSELAGAIRYQAFDASPDRVDELATRLEAQGLGAALEPATATPEAGAILANELLDAMPVHRVEGGPDGRLLERFVDLAPDGTFREVAAEPSTERLATRLAAEEVALQPGQIAEVCLALDDWLAAAAATLARGSLLLMDYGHDAAELYRPDRGSLLRAYHRHRVHDDPFVAIGRQDLTAHVDLTAVEQAAAAAGLHPMGRTTQARFLADLGVGDLLVGLQSDPAMTLPAYLEAKSALVRMLDPRATGGFAVLGFARGLPADAPFRGFGAPPRFDGRPR